MNIQVVYAQPDTVWQVDLQMPPGSTVHAALESSRFVQHFPDYAGKVPEVGIYGQRCDVDRVLVDGDRVEIYRSLTFDPMESRRRRALHRTEAKTNVMRTTK
jgi:putative ubiquitin-RnfH superfamily antitoxin RatB of RatAB toxin-antitoxin module